MTCLATTERVTYLALVMGVIASACTTSKSPVKKPRRNPLVAVAKARVMRLDRTLSLTGTIEPTRVARMATPVEGPVIACPVREGDRVRAGQLLARIGRTKGDRAAATSARNELDTAKLELSRVTKLVRSGALPGEKLDQARLTVSKARARLVGANERLGDYRIVAPWQGLVYRVHVAEGDYVVARFTLVEVFDPSSLRLRFAVPEVSATSIGEKSLVSVTLDAYPGRKFIGKVVRVYPEIDRRTRTRLVEARLKGNVDLVPGMFARLVVLVSSTPDAIVVPPRAVLHPDDSHHVVFVITRGDRVERRVVKTGFEAGETLQIVCGVLPGERVVVAGQAKLRSGMKVRIASEPRPGGRPLPRGNAPPLGRSVPQSLP